MTRTAGTQAVRDDLRHQPQAAHALGRSVMPRMGAVMGMANHIVWQQMFEGRFWTATSPSRAFISTPKRSSASSHKTSCSSSMSNRAGSRCASSWAFRFPKACRFHMNDTAEFKQRIVRLQVVQTAALAVLGAAAVWLGVSPAGARGR